MKSSYKNSTLTHWRCYKGRHSCWKVGLQQCAYRAMGHFWWKTWSEISRMQASHLQGLQLLPFDAKGSVELDNDSRRSLMWPRGGSFVKIPAKPSGRIEFSWTRPFSQLSPSLKLVIEEAQVHFRYVNNPFWQFLPKPRNSICPVFYSNCFKINYCPTWGIVKGLLCESLTWCKLFTNWFKFLKMVVERLQANQTQMPGVQRSVYGYRNHSSRTTCREWTALLPWSLKSIW